MNILFISIEGNTRSFLTRLQAYAQQQHSFNPQLPTYPCLDQNQTILEIKYNRRFPEFILPITSSIPAQRSAISKYTICRRYEFNM